MQSGTYKEADIQERNKERQGKWGVSLSNKKIILKLSQNIFESLLICFLSWSESFSGCGLFENCKEHFDGGRENQKRERCKADF